MDSVKELDERSNSFFDEQDEERILAELNRRYENASGAKNNLHLNQMQTTDQFMKEMGVMNSDVLKSGQTQAAMKNTEQFMRQMGVNSDALKSSKVPAMKNTEQFMREMGVVGSEVLQSNHGNSQVNSAWKGQPLNRDLASIETPNLNYDYARNPSTIQTGEKFGSMNKPAPYLNNQYNKLPTVEPFTNFDIDAMSSQYNSQMPSNKMSPEKAAPIFNQQDSDRVIGGPTAGPVSGPGHADYGQYQLGEAPVGESQPGEELSYYAIDSITSISDLVQSQSLLQYQNSYITSLRIMHCENFSNINGIQIPMFQNLHELNLSSNQIEDISELNVLSHIKDLNLSCNKITKIQGLDNMLRSLQKITLSHNRISSLQYFATRIQNGQDAPNLAFIDMNDNYIGDLGQIQNLKSIGSLKEIVFQSKTSSNPLCDFENYKDAILSYLPQINKLDGQSIYDLGIEFKSGGDNGNNNNGLDKDYNVASTFHGHQGINNYNHGAVLDQINQSSAARTNIQLEGARTNVSAAEQRGMMYNNTQGMLQSSSQFNKQPGHLEHMRLQNDLRETIQTLENKLKTTVAERDDTLTKYDENERNWKRKEDNLLKNQKDLFEMNSSLKDDNKELLMDIDKYIKRVKQLENTLDREQECHKDTQRLIADYKRDKQGLIDQLTDAKEEVQKHQKTQLETQVALDGEALKLKETQSCLKMEEEKRHQLYQDLMNSNNKGMERWQEMQRKYEESQDVITKQLVAIDEASKKLSDLKDVNNQLEYSWGQKYQDDIAKKDREIRKLNADNQDKIEALELQHSNEVKQLKVTFRDDIIIIDKELNKQIQLKKQAIQQSQRTQKENEEMKTLLRAAAISDEKKTALLEEMKVAVGAERENLSKQLGEVTKDKSQLNDYRRIKEEEILAVKKNLDETTFKLKETEMKHDNINERYSKLAKEQQSSLKLIDDLKSELEDLSNTLEKVKAEGAQYEETLKRECEDLRVESEDLSDLLKTKDRMLEDQNIVIANQKKLVKEKEEEIKQLTESKGKYRDFYDDKLQQEYEEQEKLKAKIDELQNQVNNAEYDLDQARQELHEAQDNLTQTKEQLKDKDQVIEFVEQEVTKIKEKQDEDLQEHQDKEELLNSQAGQVEQLSRQIDIKNEEIKILLERMEQYKKHKDDQIHKLKFSLNKAQSDIKLLVDEHEKQKHKAAEKVRMLSEMFKENS